MAVGSSADIGIRVFLDDAASAGLYNINSALGRLGTQAMYASGAFRGLSQEQLNMMGVAAGFGIAFGLFTSAIKASVDSASAFEQSMFSVAVATHVPMDTAMQYSQTLMNLAASSTFTSAQIADGIALMGRSGYSIGAIFDQMTQKGAGFTEVGGQMVPVMSSIAQAGIALGEATRSTATQGFQMLAQVMSAYQMQADQALTTANLLQFGFEHQRGAVADFAAGLNQLSPDAAKFGVTTQEVIAALDTVGPAMASTSRAGTALRYMIDGLYSPTAAGQKEMVALGLASTEAGGKFTSSFYDAQGKAVDFTTAVQLLSDKLKGMTSEEQTAALHNLFSVRGGQGADIMIQQLQKYLGLINQLKESQDNAGGVMQRWAEVMNTYQGALAGLQSSITDLSVVIGLALIPALTNAMNWMNQAISGIRALASAAPGGAATFLLIGAALSAVGLVAAIVVLAIMGIGTALLTVMGIAIGVVVGVVALTVAITALVIWIHNLSQAPGPLGNIIRMLLSEFTSLGSYISAQMGPMFSFVGQMFRTMGINGESLMNVLRFLGVIIGSVLVLAIAILIGVLKGLIMGFTAFIGGLALVVGGITQILNGITNVILGFFRVILGIVHGNGAEIVAGFQQMGTGIRQWFQGAFTVMVGIVLATFGTIIGFVSGVIGFFQHLATVLVGHSIVPDMLNAIRNVIVGGLAAILGSIAGFVGQVISDFTRLGSTITSTVTSAWNQFRSVVSSGIALAVSVVASGAAQMVAHVLSLGSSIIATANNAWGGFRNAVASGVNSAIGIVASLPGRIVGIMGGLGGMLYASGQNAMSMFASGLGSMLGAVVSQVAAAANAVAGFLAHHSPAKMGPLADDDKWMPNMMRMMAQGIEANAPLLQNALSRATGNMASVPRAVQTATNMNAAAAASAARTGTSTQNINLVVDGRVLTTVVMNNLTGQMQLNGLGRAFR